MDPTDALRLAFRRNVDEVIPADGTDASTRFSAAEVDEILIAASTIEAASSVGWTRKALRAMSERGGLQKTQAGSERLPKRALADRVARLLEPVALRRVSHIIGVSSGTTRMVTARYPWLSDRDTTEIPFGGEPEDLAWIRKHPIRCS